MKRHKVREYDSGDQAALARLFDRADRHDGVARALSPTDGEEVPIYAFAPRYPLGLERGITTAELRSRLGRHFSQFGRHLLVVAGADHAKACLSLYPVRSVDQWMLDWVVEPDRREEVAPAEILEAGLAQIRKLVADLLRSNWEGDFASGQQQRVSCGVEARGLREDAATRDALNRAGFAGVRSFGIFARDLGDSPSAGEKTPREPDGIALRAYREGDAPQWIKAFNGSFSDHWGGFYYTEESWGRHTASPRFRNEISVVAEADGTLAGVCHCAPSHNPKERGLAHLHILGVQPQFRRRGLGYRLMVEALRRLRQNGFSRVELDMDTLNAKALPLYEMLGFRQQEVITLYHRQLSVDIGPPA